MRLTFQVVEMRVPFDDRIFQVCSSIFDIDDVICDTTTTSIYLFFIRWDGYAQHIDYWDLVAAIVSWNQLRLNTLFLSSNDLAQGYQVT